jgi:hypothetical protein
MRVDSLFELIRARDDDGVDVSFERRGSTLLIISQNVTEMCSFLPTINICIYIEVGD